MRYKLLGRSGLRVSELCLGTMAFGQVGLGRVQRGEQEDDRPVRRSGRQLHRHIHIAPPGNHLRCKRVANAEENSGRIDKLAGHHSTSRPVSTAARVTVMLSISLWGSDSTRALTSAMTAKGRT
jgi:hypothetical protein